MRKLALTLPGIALAVAFLAVIGGSVISAQGQTFPDIIPLPDGFQPEGIAVGRDINFFVGSLGRPSDDGTTVIGGAIYKGSLKTGEGDILVPAQEGRTALGLAVDVRSNRLFVAGGPFGAGYVYDAQSGGLLAEYQFVDPPQNTLVNDVIVTRDAAYFTDSFRPFLYRVPLGPGGELPDPPAFTEIPLGEGFGFEDGGFNSNGIEATPNGEHLIIVNTTLGTLYRVDPDTGDATEIDLGGDSVDSGDGLLLNGKTLYVVQNSLNQVAVVELDSDFRSGTVTETITNPNFRVPTTIAKFGPDLLYVVNARFDVAPPPFSGSPADPNLEYEVVKISRP